MRVTGAVVVFLVAFAGCARQGPVSGAIELAVPERANANVTLASAGRRVAAAWAATGAAATDIYLAVSDDEGRTFAPAVRVNDVAGDASVSGEQPPRIAMKGNTVSVIWVSKRSGVAGVRSALSTDGGATFAAAQSITPPDATGARGWESVTFADDGMLHAAWLDGRKASAVSSTGAPPERPTPASAPAHHHDGPMKQNIYHAMWRAGEAPVETEIAEDVCFCCKTAIVSRGRSVYIAWRHLFPGGVRDIAIARSSDGGRTFSGPVRVSEDNWKIDACPDDGPAMTIDADGTLRVVWPTLVQDGAGARMGIFQAVSRDGGATFAPRARVDMGTGAPAHPRIADFAQGEGVVWDELAGGTRRVMLRMGGAPPVALSDGRAASYPAIAATTDGFVVAFTDQSEGRSSIRALRISAVRQ